MKQFVSQDPRSYPLYFDLKIRFRARNVTGIFEKWATGPVKRATCTNFVAKSRTTPYFLQQIFAACKKMICCRTGGMWVVNAQTSLFNSCCSNNANKVARFCCPFYRTFRFRVLNNVRFCVSIWQDGMDCCESN